MNNKELEFQIVFREHEGADLLAQRWTGESWLKVRKAFFRDNPDAILSKIEYLHKKGDLLYLH